VDGYVYGGFLSGGIDLYGFQAGGLWLGRLENLLIPILGGELEK
jgi:hypothetical protein